MAAEDLITILHLSDLHLGENFEDIGADDKGTATSFWKKGRLEMQSHDGFIFATLREELKKAAKIVGAVNERFDMHVVTGDISTNATTEKRFEFARDFLVGKILISPAFEAGLELDATTLLCIPGNHDKMTEVSSQRYLKGFGNFPEPPDFIYSKTIRDRKFFFIGIDSNSYKEGNVALGEISPATLGWLNHKLYEVENESDAVVILMLHHHPADLNKFRKRSFKDVLAGRFSVLKDGEKLLELCKGRVDIIIHGHEHFPIAFKDAASECVIVSAGTTMEWQSNKTNANSFHVLLFRGRQLEVAQFNCSTGARFVRDSSREFKFLLPNRATANVSNPAQVSEVLQD